MKAFKILSNQEESIVTRGKMRVSYSRDRYVEAPVFLAEHGYHLTVFRMMEDAIEACLEHRWYHDTARLWSVDAQGVRDDLPSFVGVNIIAAHRGYFRSRPEVQQDEMVVEQLDWPKGTLMAERVKLDTYIGTLSVHNIFFVRSLLQERSIAQ